MHNMNYAVTRCMSVRLSICHTLVFCQNGSMTVSSTTDKRHDSNFAVPNVTVSFQRGRRMQEV